MAWKSARLIACFLRRSFLVSLIVAAAPREGKSELSFFGSPRDGKLPFCTVGTAMGPELTTRNWLDYVLFI